MFAQRKKINVFHYHHVAVVFLELGRIQNFFRVFGVSPRQRLHRLSHPIRRLLQSFTFGIFPQQSQNSLIVGF